ncbi:MAG TPA: TonB-dependent receptor [Candidatus Acidoferrales bacterium]|nr:TonB-dependent receptor [Candidatus Acidoferrales bacterium]
MRRMVLLLLVNLLLIPSLVAQSPSGSISGIVHDPSGAVIAGAEILVVNDATGVQYSTTTNSEGIYLVPNLPPGSYRIQVAEIGFKTLIKPDIILHVQDALAINFTLPIGAASETVTVKGGTPLIDTQDASVSTIVDQNFADNLPMNGRSFQTLIQLTPGVVLTQNSEGNEGQFSVNGQRAASNYWMVDGVSANIGIGANFNGGNGVGGALGSFSVLGGTNSLVSVDAMREFRIQTSTYAPEFGRTPGAQISIVTRSGTNQFHGTAFDYLRNSVLDANNWFADEASLPKAQERQNDFGGTFSGPIAKDRTFFFFSYEGLRLRLPETKLTTVPDLSARQNAAAAVQPFLNAYPLPNGMDSVATGTAQFNASYSNPATLDAYSVRLDHKLTAKLSLFGRYDYSPSDMNERGTSTELPLSDVQTYSITTQTATAAADWVITPFMMNDLRFNYSKADASSFYSLDTFGGAVPLATLPFPSPYSAKNATLTFAIFGLANPYLSAGSNTRNAQRQINLIDGLSFQKGSHEMKFGIDYRRMTPQFDPALYVQGIYFANVSSAEGNDLLAANLISARGATLRLQNLGIFAQDTWRVIPRLTVTYGLRWDVDIAPSSVNGPSLPAVTGYNLEDLSNLTLAPAGVPVFSTTFGNVAPRLGLAYQVSKNPDWGLVLRGGVGMFYDLATSEVGNALGIDYPFGASMLVFGPSFGGTATFPLSSADAAPPSITPAELSSPGAVLSAFDPHLELPYALEWNVALEQGLGKQQSLSASYIGSAGRRLLQAAYVASPNSTFSNALLVGNTAASNYNALQLQFQRRFSHGLQILSSYTWSHSIDDASNGTFGVGPNALVPGLSANSNRGPSDFDIRNSFSAGFSYNIPAPRVGGWANAILRGWALENVIQARSSSPVNVYYSQYTQLLGAFAEVRPDVVAGTPFYVEGTQYPGGRAINPAAFMAPPTDSSGSPTRQGDLGRNALRGFGATQWDFAVHRDFPIHESLKLQFRAEMFNFLNHPNFAPPIGDLQNPLSVNPQFGRSTQTLGQYLGGSNVGGGGFSALYQIGGPRSIQCALKLTF